MAARDARHRAHRPIIQESESMIAIRQDIRPEDYRRAVYLHLRSRPVFGAAGILILALATLGSIHKLYSPDPWNSSTFVPLASLAFLAVYVFVVIPWRTTKHYQQNRFLTHAAECRIDEAGLHARSDLGTTEIPWDHLHRWKENNRLILLYSTDAMYFIFPRRLFVPAEWEEFRALAAQHLKKIR